MRKTILAMLTIIASGVCLTTSSVSATKQVVVANAFSQEISNGLNEVSGGSTASAGDIAKTVINGLLFLIGIIAVIMIIYGGLRYTTSVGDANKIAAAKNTIIYSVIGLIVALFAYAIVNFVVQTFSSGGSGNSSTNSTTNNTNNNNDNSTPAANNQKSGQQKNHSTNSRDPE